MIIIAVFILLGGCSDNTPENVIPENSTDSITNSETSEIDTETPAVTQEPTPEPTIEPEQFDVNSISSDSLNGLLKTQEIPEETTQLILVAVDNAAEKMFLLEKHENRMWQVVYGPFDVQIGKNGLGKEKEGDGKSPEGIFELGYVFGREPIPLGTIWPWRTTEDGDIWVEDSRSKYYNMFVEKDSIEEPDWVYYSNLNILVFERAIEIRYNSDRVPGAGSAIFLHIWVSPTRDTNGCTAISRANIETLISWLDPEANTMIAQLPYDLPGNGELVYLTDYDYDIVPDIRFAGNENILGTALKGYEDNQIITKADIANKLAEINGILKNYDRKLIVYEAYRPVDGFNQFRDWLLDREDESGMETYYPSYSKSELINEFFSIDSDRLYLRGQILHLGLADLYNNPLDMGGDYMVFDEFASYECEGLSQEQIFNRQLLHDIMVQAGFTSYDNQWWKFAYNPTIYADMYEEVIK